MVAFPNTPSLLSSALWPLLPPYKGPHQMWPPVLDFLVFGTLSQSQCFPLHIYTVSVSVIGTESRLIWLNDVEWKKLSFTFYIKKWKFSIIPIEQMTKQNYSKKLGCGSLAMNLVPFCEDGESVLCWGSLREAVYITAGSIFLEFDPVKSCTKVALSVTASATVTVL